MSGGIVVVRFTQPHRIGDQQGSMLLHARGCTRPVTKYLAMKLVAKGVAEYIEEGNPEVAPEKQSQ